MMVDDACSRGQWRSDPNNIVHIVFLRMRLVASPACQALTKIGCSVWARFPFFYSARGFLHPGNRPVPTFWAGP